MKRKVYTDGNGSSIILVDGLGEYVPKSEFVKIKAELEQHDDQITNIEEANRLISDVANDKILALMAMVNALKSSLAEITKEENIHPIKDWAICGICANSSSGSEGRKTRMKKFYKFFELIDHANKLLEK